MALPDRSRFDVNKRPTLIATSNIDGESPVTLWADPSTHALITNTTGGGGSGGLIPGISYDYIDAQQTSPTVDTFVYKLGGSGGTTVQTIVVTYTDSTKTDIDTIVYS